MGGDRNVRGREEQREENRDILHDVLVAALHAVEGLGVLVTLFRVHLQHRQGHNQLSTVLCRRFDSIRFSRTCG